LEESIRGDEVGLAQVGPVFLGGVESAGGADEEVRVREVAAVEVLGDGVIGDLVRGKLAGI